jgi:hypothetical protein
MLSSSASERLDRFYLYSILKDLSDIGQCPMKMNFQVPKNKRGGALQMGHKT